MNLNVHTPQLLHPYSGPPRLNPHWPSLGDAHEISTPHNGRVKAPVMTFVFRTLLPQPGLGSQHVPVGGHMGRYRQARLKVKGVIFQAKFRR